MSNGLIMIGLQVITMAVTSVIIIRWIQAPKDKYDEMLEQMMGGTNEAANS